MIKFIGVVSVILLARWHLCMSSMFLLLTVFGSNVLHQRIMFAKLLYLIRVLVHYRESSVEHFMFARWRLYMCFNGPPLGTCGTCVHFVLHTF